MGGKVTGFSGSGIAILEISKISSPSSFQPRQTTEPVFVRNLPLRCIQHPSETFSPHDGIWWSCW